MHFGLTEATRRDKTSCLCDYRRGCGDMLCIHQTSIALDCSRATGFFALSACSGVGSARRARLAAGVKITWNKDHGIKWDYIWGYIGYIWNYFWYKRGFIGSYIGLLLYIYIAMCVCVCVYVCMYVCMYVCK